MSDTMIKNLPATMTNGVAQNLFHIGSHCFVRVGQNSQDAEIVGFVDNADGSKNIQTQDARVIGSVIPASIDAVGIDVQLNLSGFVATKDVYNGTQQYNGGGTVSLSSLIRNHQITRKVL